MAEAPPGAQTTGPAERWLAFIPTPPSRDVRRRAGRPMMGLQESSQRETMIMPTYIMLANWTEQGIHTVKNSPQRLEAAKAMAAALGGELTSFHMTMGEYDMVAIYQAPSDDMAARFSLQLGMEGSIRTKTLKAFPEEEYREIIGALG
jgi:uncharacterized protein with GYD domain